MSVYIHEVTTTTTTTTESASTLDPYLILKYLKDRNLSAESLDEEQFLRNISENLELELESARSGEVYVAVGIVSGVVVMVIILLGSIIMVTKRKRSQRGERGGGSSTPSSNTSQVRHQPITKVSGFSTPIRGQREEYCTVSQ